MPASIPEDLCAECCGFRIGTGIYWLKKINWLKHYNAPLIRKLSENKDINKSIRNCFIEAYGERKLDSELMDIYFHYFAK